MSRDQKVARVNVSDDEWIEFRTFAMRQRRSIADYLGALVRRELARDVEARGRTSSGEPRTISRGIDVTRASG